MHKIADIYKILDEISPFELQESWDNSGLLVGSMKDTIKDVVLSIDVTEEILEDITPNSLIITHHPLIFSPLKRIDDSYPSNLITAMIKKDIKLISMHTNIDKTHLNIALAKKLGMNVLSEESMGVFLDSENKSFDELIGFLKDRLNNQTIKCSKYSDDLGKVFLLSGSGMSILEYVNCDTIITGDVKYHDAISANSEQINVIDIGHYESEVHFAEVLDDCLEKKQIKAIIKNSSNPFFYA